MATSDFTAERLRELLSYDAKTGVFRWVVERQGVKTDKIAGTVNGSGYRIISIDGRIYRANRLAWLYMTGSWPAAQIDHKNGVTSDDRFDNLRDVVQSVNQQNKQSARKDSGSGIIGVRWDKSRSKWRARISIDSMHRHLGYFKTAEEAKSAYFAAKRIFHPESRA